LLDINAEGDNKGDNKTAAARGSYWP